MRQIIFRGKRIDNNKWTEGSLISLGDGAMITPHRAKLVQDGYNISTKAFEVDPETLGQSTEMHDRYNTLVFENDIVEFVGGGSTSRYLIWWNREMSMMTAVPIHGIYFNGHDYGNGDYQNFNYSTFCLMMQDPWGDFSDIRVIGNIHDNPELLNGCKNYGTEVLPNGRF